MISRNGSSHPFCYDRDEVEKMYACLKTQEELHLAIVAQKKMQIDIDARDRQFFSTWQGKTTLVLLGLGTGYILNDQLNQNR